jgi:CelD/BcsL family acetyltransferase involved in cellulose biosynthesis
VLQHALCAIHAQVRSSGAAPYVDFSPHTSFEHLKQTRNKKTMKNLRNSVNRLRREGAISATTTREPNEFVQVASRALRNRLKWLETRGKTAPAFRLAGYDRLLLGDSADGLVGKRVAFALTCAGKPLAEQIGFLHDNRYYAYLSGMDWDREVFAPGRVHLAFVLEATFNLGLRGAELLSPANDYKLAWTDQVRELVDLSVPLTRRGRLTFACWDRGLRPGFKAAYHALPSLARRILLSLAKRDASKES